MSSLSDRVAKALQTESTSDALISLIDDAQDELEAAEEACAEAQAKVLDPLSTTAVVAKAKREFDDQTLVAARLKVALERLSDKMASARAREAEAVRVKRYDEVAAKREAVIKHFEERYANLAAEIATMLMQIQVVDREVAAVNHDLPQGAAHLPLVDRTIRSGLGWSFADGVKLPALSGTEVPEHLRVAQGQVQFWPMARGF
jgi:DNA repair exonuclease SbcCD ATPase subunit